MDTASSLSVYGERARRVEEGDFLGVPVHYNVTEAFWLWKPPKFVLSTTTAVRSEDKIPVENDTTTERSSEQQTEEASSTKEDLEESSVELEFDLDTPCCGESKCHSEATCGNRILEAVTTSFARLVPGLGCFAMVP